MGASGVVLEGAPPNPVQDVTDSGAASRNGRARRNTAGSVTILPCGKPGPMPSDENTISPFGYAGSAYMMSPRPWAGANRTNVAAAVCASLLHASDQRPKMSWLTSTERP